MGKKKHNYPKTIEELMEIIYGNNYEKKKKYFDTIQTNITSKQYEEEINNFISTNLVVKNMNEKKKHNSYDKIIESEKIIFDVTSIDVPLISYGKYELSPENLYRKFKEAILHVEKKNKQEYEDFVSGAIIFLSEITLLFIDSMSNNKWLKGLFVIVKNCDFKILKIDFLLILPAPVNNNYNKYPPVIFIKEPIIIESMKKVFPNIRIEII
jgi:hypothetical protein